MTLPEFIIVGLSHRTTPVEVREKLAIPENQIAEILSQLVKENEIEEALLLSTCNRVEVCMVSANPETATRVIRKMLAERSGLSETQLNSHLYVKKEQKAVGHFFRVTAGLDSMVLGEPQIGGQIKEAYQRAVLHQTTGAYLNKLVHRALNVNKKIRTETDIGKYPVSVSYAAVLLVEKIFGDLEKKQVLLIGAGEMGALAAKHLKERHVEKIWISNRTGEKAEAVADEIGAEFLPFSQMIDRLVDMDIVITSTGSETYVVKADDVREAMKKRKNQSMFFIDIAVPRNIEPEVNQIENVYLYDIDHLKGLVENNLQEREKEARKAEDLVEEEVQSFLDYLSAIKVAPTIQQLSQKLESIRNTEVEKYYARGLAASGSEKEMLEACTRAIVNKILHEPIILMKTEEVKEGGTKYSEILKKLFRLEGES